MLGALSLAIVMGRRLLDGVMAISLAVALRGHHQQPDLEQSSRSIRTTTRNRQLTMWGNPNVGVALLLAWMIVATLQLILVKLRSALLVARHQKEAASFPTGGCRLDNKLLRKKPGGIQFLDNLKHLWQRVWLTSLCLRRLSMLCTALVSGFPLRASATSRATGN